MKTPSVSMTLVAASAFAGGYFSGLLLAPRTGRAARRRLTRQARASSKWLGGRVHALEAQLAALEQEIEALGHQFSAKVRAATHGAFNAFVPGFPDGWGLERGEMARELRHLPRR